MAPKTDPVLPEWSIKVESLRKWLGLNQHEFSEKVGVSPMSASRWERGAIEPSEGAYIKLGNLASDPLCWYFWRRAGLSTADLMRVWPTAKRRLARNKTSLLQVVHAGVKETKLHEKAELIAVPLLPVVVAAPGEKGDSEVDLDQILPERLLAAPREWCPNPKSTVCMRVKGNSMSPLILDGYIIAVDTADVRRNKLVGQVVVAQNIDRGLLVSRLLRFGNTDVLISDHREYDSVSLAADSRWRILGKVLWWTGQAR